MTRQPKPSWLKVKAPGGERYQHIKKRARQLKLATVCEEAQCPNIAECYGKGTATFMVLGDICTRNCRFCAIPIKRPRQVDTEEPDLGEVYQGDGRYQRDISELLN